LHYFLRVTKLVLEGCRNDGRRIYVDIDGCKVAVNQPAIYRSSLWPHTLHTSYTSDSFRPENHFSSHLNLTPSSPTKFRNRHPAHIMHLNIQLRRERRETNRGYISALCNRELLSTQAEANCIAFLLLICVYSFNLTSIKYQRLL
jgi:hypothetical protein